MKKVIAIMVLQLISINMSADNMNLIREVKQQLAQIESIKPESRHATTAPGTFERWKKFPEFEQLEKTVSQNWKGIIENLEEIAGSSETRQYILFLSFLSLPQQETLQCLNKVADLCLDNTVSKDTFYGITLYYEEAMSPLHRLALNYKDPVVAEVLRKAKHINPEMSAYYDRMISGDAKKTITSFWYEPPNQPTPYRIIVVVFWLPILVGISAVIGAILAWRYFRRRKKRKCV